MCMLIAAALVVVLNFSFLLGVVHKQIAAVDSRNKLDINPFLVDTDILVYYCFCLQLWIIDLASFPGLPLS